MIKGKKGQLLIYGMIAGLIAAVVIAFISSVMGEKEFPVIGDSSLRLMHSSIKAEQALQYIDQSAKFSAYKSIYETADIGGCDGENIYSGYSLWNIDNQDSNPSECDPSSEFPKNNFLRIFSDNLEENFLAYTLIKLPWEDLDFGFNFENNDFIGVAENFLKIPAEAAVTYKSTCNAICGDSNCIMGIDEGNQERKCDAKFGFEGEDDYCICGEGTVEEVPGPLSVKTSCNTICVNNCIRGIDDGNKDIKCNVEFGFEGADDYCICGEGSTEVVPAPHDDANCNTICHENSKSCIMGIDDGNKNKKCVENFGFEGDDDYCICGTGSVDEQTEILGKYFIKPSFKVGLENYSLSDYGEVGILARDLILRCESKSTKRWDKSTKKCIDANKIVSFDTPDFVLENVICETSPKFLDYRTPLDVRYSIYGFCVKNKNDEFYAYDEDDKKTELRDIVYKFSLQFEDAQCNLLDDPPDTHCLALDCSSYASCGPVAEEICYCNPSNPTLKNACIGTCFAFCSSDNEALLTDDDVEAVDADKTLCAEFSCTSYMACGCTSGSTNSEGSCNSELDTCGCPDPDDPINNDACMGDNCVTLHCSRDGEFEAKEGKTTNCRQEECGYYDDIPPHSCSGPTDLCQCDSGIACEGDCTCIDDHSTEACGCGDSDKVTVIFPYGCDESSYTYCTSCVPSCDRPCGCDYGSQCGPCGNKECPPEEDDDDDGLIKNGDEGNEGNDGSGGGSSND